MDEEIRKAIEEETKKEMKSAFFKAGILAICGILFIATPIISMITIESSASIIGVIHFSILGLAIVLISVTYAILKHAEILVIANELDKE